MIYVLSCITDTHDYWMVAAAALVCAIGATISMRLAARVRRSEGQRKWHWLFVAGVTGGCSVWTTHFVAMLGYEPPFEHGYDPLLTLLSLFIAIAGMTISLAVTIATQKSWLVESGGVLVGLSIAAMHFVGMAGYLVPGHIVWDPVLVVVSIALGCFFGAIAVNRIARPLTRFCKYGGSLSFALAICLLHFVAMSAVTLVPDPTIIVPQQSIDEFSLALAVIAVMSLAVGTGISTYVIDNKNHAEAVEHYKHLALHDPLTGLANRALLNTRLGKLIDRPDDDTALVGIYTIDLDRFKDINDVHGHTAGDHVLKTIAARLSGKLDGVTFLARTGGDELIAVKPDIYSKRELLDFARMLLAETCQPIPHGSAALVVGASIGISVFPNDANNREELISQSDLAMYRAKSSSTEKIALYDPSMDERRRSRSALAIELRDALERNEFELHYQPQNDVVSREVIGFEVLLRWRHTTRGLVSPAEFVPIAEETGLIVPIGSWVLHRACQDATAWRREFKIAVNVAAAQLAQRDYVESVEATLAETGLAPSRLELEITESSLIDDQQYARQVIQSLKALGVTIAMDDYGTGYSSLSTLQGFPFDKIKIDRSFVDAMTRDEQAAAIVKSTLILARSLNIPVLAEGVENEEQLAVLRAEGCQAAQGYFFSKPKPLEDIRNIVDGRTDDALTIEPGNFDEDKRAEERGTQTAVLA